MKVLAYVHRFPPDHNAGAEWMLYHTLDYLRGRGHEVAVSCANPMSVRSFQGIPVEGRVNLRALTTRYQWADVVLTHLDVTRHAVTLAARRNRPLVHLVHNHRQLEFHHVPARYCQLAVFNSDWLRKEVAWPGDQMVLHPPVPPDAYRIEGPHDRVLLSNLIAAKGSLLAFAVAAELPEVPFLFVRGAYGIQEEPPRLPNVEVVNITPDFRVHLARARLVLMPSSYESWGRVAIEAACSGTPTIASYAGGLMEALDGHGTHLDVESEQVIERPPPWGIVRPTPKTVKAWKTAIMKVLNESSRQVEIRAHADRLWARTLSQLAEFERRLLAL